MKFMRHIARIVVAIVLLALAVTAFAGGFTEAWIWYYSDSGFTNQVGWYHDTCSNVITSGGVQGTYRVREISSCETATYSETCSYWNGSSWQPMTCPW
jgi:hypothetical protein